MQPRSQTQYEILLLDVVVITDIVYLIDAQAGDTGVSYEYIVRLVNELKVSPWINVPHETTDDYVRQLAMFFKKNIDRGVPRIYVEYSNEVSRIAATLKDL